MRTKQDKYTVNTMPLNSLENYQYTVIFARYDNKWLYCRQRESQDFETPGGRINEGETPLVAAKRELYEETGAVKYEIKAVCDYMVGRNGQSSNGQVYVAYIDAFEGLPDYEMAEIALFDTIPEKMRFPQILPILYEDLQVWLNISSAIGENWDIYDENRNLTGRIHPRGEWLKKREYHLCVIILLQNPKGEFLLTKRAPTKGFPNLWECQGGSAVAGDDSLTAAIREMKEEAGIELHPENGRILFTQKGDDFFCDVWHFRQEFKLEDVILQEGETVDAKLATLDEIKELVERGRFIPCDFIEGVFRRLEE